MNRVRLLFTALAGVLLGSVLLTPTALAQKTRHTFALGKTEFLLDGKPFQMIGGEMHPARIPREYWQQRIQMAKAMGCNTIAAYVFWNYHESKPGVFDFKTENRDIVEFIKLAQQEGLWVLLRPGPYVCAEWDFGGIPPYLLKNADLKVRCLDPAYMAASERYIKKLAALVKPLLVTKGGPILMVQVENEYGSYANDREYMKTIYELWLKNGIDVPFYTADGPAVANLTAGSLPGVAVGLDPGANQGNFDLAQKMNPDVPVFSSESYPGWLTHWGEKWARPDTAGFLKEIRFLLDTKKSFNLYVVHGGTNFGYTAGANGFKPTEYQPDITSYDYDAPINEQGQATPKYHALRRLIGQHVGQLPEIPAAIPAMEISEIKLTAFTSVWENLPKPVRVAQPKPMEMFDQYEGFVLYRTKIVGYQPGTLTITEPHDYAQVLLDGNYIGHIYRDGGKWSIELPKTDNKEPVLDILVEGMGRINFAQYMIDRKGITDRVSLNSMTLMNWDVYNLPVDGQYINQLKSTQTDVSRSGQSRPGLTRPGQFFKGSFALNSVADTYFDLSQYKKGVVFINGHNLGRYWEVGPQKRLYCPASWLKKGQNEIVVFDLHQLKPAPVNGVKTLD